jgi:hypothetical protein
MRTTPFSLKTPYCRSVPSMHPPSPVLLAATSMKPVWWPWLKRVTTRSPAFHLETLEPTATISPAPSEPATMGRLRGKMYFP